MGRLILKNEVAVAHTMRVASEVYDYLYLKGQQLFVEYDPCAVRNGTCRNGRQYHNGNSFCCYGCKHLSKEGCTVQSLCCKLWLCGGFRIEPELKVRIDELYDMAHHGWSEGLLWIGGDKPEYSACSASLSSGVRRSKPEHMEWVQQALETHHMAHDVKLITTQLKPTHVIDAELMRIDNRPPAQHNPYGPYIYADGLGRKQVWIPH